MVKTSWKVFGTLFIEAPALSWSRFPVVNLMDCVLHRQWLRLGIKIQWCSFSRLIQPDLEESGWLLMTFSGSSLYSELGI
jgi:hypothetical protein